MTLSKSDYILFLKHPAWMWLKKHEKTKLPPPDESLEALFESGYLFETYAVQLFPDGVKLGFSDYDEYLSLPARTKKALEGEAEIIFQGRFEHEELTCICDVVVKVGEKTLDLYEIKGTTEVKELHEYDLAFQLAVLEGCGYTVRNIYVLHVNNEYVRAGAIDPKQFVTQTDVTEKVRARHADTKLYIESALQVMHSRTIPNISPSHAQFDSLKDWVAIYRTLVKLPAGSIYDLTRLNVELIDELEVMGVDKIVDIPEDVKLGAQQQNEVTATKQNIVKIERNEIAGFLSKFEYPLYFFDYETLMNVVPDFDGVRPYQQVPFQYSLHILEAPGGELRHVGYLHQDNSNPVHALTSALKSHIGDTGTVIAWNMGFEKGRNTEMGEMFPEYAEFYRSVNDRVQDLMVPFQKGWYVHKDFLGSASIKKVLPVLVPDLSYAALEIHEGTAAQRIWMETVLEGLHSEKKAEIMQHLDDYCTLDTKAMVKIYKKLVSLGIG